MVLDSRYLETCLAQNLVGTTDFGDVVVRRTHTFHLARLEQGYQPRRPALHVHRIVNPVDVDVVQSHALQRGICHLLHRVLIDLSQLRREFRGYLNVFAAIVLSQRGENFF